MRVLLIYKSRHGQTRKVCEHIARVARIHGADAHAWELSTLPRELRINAFDHIVLAGPVYFGKHPKKLGRFIAGHRVQLAKVRTTFLSVSGSAGNPEQRPEAEAAVQRFLEELQWTPDHIELVAGGEPYTRYGFFTKWMMVWHMRRLGRDVDPGRDYEYTNWDAVDRFARQLAGAGIDVAIRSAACLS